jgi:glycosyltransferase involved in cell wall biosynthesis
MARNGNKITVTVSNDIVTDQRMERICSSLAGMGFEVEIVGRRLPNSLPLGVKEYQQSRLKLAFKKGPLFYAALNIRLLFYLLATKPDTIYTVDADTALAGLLAKKLLRTKLIFDAHELFSEVPELQNRGIIKRIWQWIEKLLILKSDVRITVSEGVANYYTNKYNKPFEVIRNISRTKTHLISNAAEKYILYQGALNEGRGLEQLIEAASHLDIKVKIAGDGDISETLKKLANYNVEFLGKLVPDELEKVTTNAWLGYNLLEKRSLSYYYSLSNKTFDYMQAGIPQLIPDFPEYQKLNKEWNFGVIVGLSSEEIVKTVRQLLEDQNLYSLLKVNAEKAGRVLTWENEEEKLTEIFDNFSRGL